MKITVAEAMRLKGEISKAIQTLQSTPISNGKVTEGGVCVFDDSRHVPLTTYILNMQKLFSFSEELNSKLALFNVEKGVSDIVRSKANVEYLISIYQNALPNSTQKEISRYETVGNSRVQIKQSFEPYVNKSEIKKQLRDLKAIKRGYLEKIDKANAQTITLDFEMSDLEEYASL